MLFHELVHASAVRFKKSGVLRRAPQPKDVGRGFVSYDELVANSVSELGTAFLGALSSEKSSKKAQ